MSQSIKVPQLVAHRGYAARYPENTLLALEEALRRGAPFVEFDVQLCADGTPVLCHDASLERTTGEKIDLREVPFSSIEHIQASEPSRFGNRFAGMDIRIPTLVLALDLMKRWPKARALVEIKTESLDRFGVEFVVKAVLKEAAAVSKQCVMISYDEVALASARALGAEGIGWVLTRWSEATRTQAEALSPDVLICNYRKIPSAKTPLWPGPWQWCFYEVTDPNLALVLFERGAALIETMDIGVMREDPRFQEGKSGDAR